MTKFRSVITNLVKALPDNPIGNFIEVSIQCDIPLGYTIDTKGAAEVRIKTTGHEKKRFTVNLCVLKDSTKLPLLLFWTERHFQRFAFLNQSLLLQLMGPVG